MKRVELTPSLLTIVTAGKLLAEGNRAQGVLILSEQNYDFQAIRQKLDPVRLVVASPKIDVQKSVRDDGVELIPLIGAGENRRGQLSQALLEAVASEILQPADKVVALFGGFDRDDLDCLSVVDLGDHLARLSIRDLQRLRTQVPLETLRSVVDLAVEIGREGREGKPVGTIFVVGDHRKVLTMSHEGVHDPFRGYSRKERELRDPRVRESIKEIAQLDGAFIIAGEGFVASAGRILDVAANGLTLPKGLGARHWAAAAISKATKAIGIAVSESSGTVRIFQNGELVLRIEPLDRAMKWHDFALDPEADGH